MSAPSSLVAEARRLSALADDAEERLAALRRRAEIASDLSIPGPSRADLTHAERVARAARAAAMGAERAAGVGRRRA